MSDEQPITELPGGITLDDLPPAYRALAMGQIGPEYIPMACPQPGYAAAIADGGMRCPATQVVQVYSRELNNFVLQNANLFSSKVDLPLGNVRPLIPLNVDPPEHAKYRKILDPLFAPKKMDALEDDILGRADRFIDAFIDRGECNFTDEFAELFPSAVFLSLMGLPWSELDVLIGLRDGILHPERINATAASDIGARFEIVNATGQRVYDYFNAALDEREAHPTDDILTHFTTAEVDGDRMTRNDILDLCFLFLIAGLDTVSDSLTCFFAYLSQHPEQRRLLVERPELIPSAVEELLRWESPVPGGVPRMATEDIELPNGHTVTAGTAMMVSYGAANMDPSEFEDPFDVRLDREVNRHIAFGGGVHRCLGSHLARRELRVALMAWHRRIPEYRLKPGHENLEYATGLRHVRNLTLTWV